MNAMKDPMTVVDRLDAALEAARPAHHAAHIDTDGDDPEWPLWYAAHLLEEVREILSRPGITRSRLVAAFVAADDDYVRTAPDVPWHRHYAERFVRGLT
jgi:hypothetical protein